MMSLMDEQNADSMGAARDSWLDAGLRAAFGADDSGVGSRSDGVLATLVQSIGVAPHICLRDVPESPAPIVHPDERLPAGVMGRAARYQVVGEIARGGIGAIYKIRDVDLGRDVAMKVLRDHHRKNPTMIQRFVEEAQIAGQLQHPGILPVYELGLHDDRTPYFTMRLVRGQTLAELLHHRPDVSTERQRYLTIFHQVCQTIAFAHAKGVIHRDLKPSNVMVGAFGEVQVVDWGLAKVARPDRTEDHTRTDESVVATVRTESEGFESLAGSVMGTPAYMAPEQARGEVARIDERTDVFALGAMLCEVLTGRPPYVGEPSDVLRRAAGGDLVAAHERLDRCGADEELIALVRACLSPEPCDRPHDAGVVAGVVERYLDALERRAHRLEVEAAEAAATARGERRARRLTVALATAICAAVLVAVGGAGWMEHQRSLRTQHNVELLEDVMQQALVRFGEAKTVRPGRPAEWNDVLALARQIEQMVGAPELDATVRRRAETLLAEIRRTDADRRLTERIEEVVIVGATHDDRASWEWMSEQLRAAYREYGLDLESLPANQIVAKIRSSPLATQLADGVELWIATEGHLMQFGVRRFTMPQLQQKIEILYAADPDPFRTKLRKLIYSGKLDLDALRKLEAEGDFDKLLPRTLSWLGTAYAMAGDGERSTAVYQRALRLHPDDFMLAFDAAYTQVPQKRWEEAIRCYHRAIALRPQTGGVWRALGIALREKGEVDAAIDALRHSIELQPAHAPTYVDLGLALEKRNSTRDAVDAYRAAVRIDPVLAIGYGRLGLALQSAGQLNEALEAFRRCHDLAKDDPSWTHPSQEWIRECERAIEQGANRPTTQPTGSSREGAPRRGETRP